MNIAGEEFNLRLEGPESAPVVMLSNSLGTTLRMWDGQVAEFARHLRVLRYDSRGHGGSVADPGPYSIERLARDALAILDALKIEKAHWVGVSMGGMVGQWLLANAGDRFERAVLANTTSHYPDPRNWNARIAAVRKEGMACISDAVVHRWFTPEFLTRRQDTASAFKATLESLSPEGYASCCAAIRDMDLREARRRIRAPTLVIAGERDQATPALLGRAIANDIGNARFETLDAAHISNVERNDAFTRLALSFLLER
jgi:3-oxoadipate enol-lactonase